ncbi:(Fe-S)-binding protein [Terrisporobacter sp.]|uniref:(Fe-S)-binding protein n=1 Tax=Terrisporobacter sp. TaxID=1965305 RepID=UPI00260AAE05|nr:(Fe-S)-binding protein [Terrisporobacter sp.]
MYLESIDLSFIQPCTTNSNRIRIKGSFSRDVEELFPYLNTYLKTAIYNKEGKTLTFNYSQKIIIMYKYEVAISKLLNETDAFETLDYLKEIINECDSKRNEIIPNYDMRKLPSPIDIYKYLPKINCGKCGVSTCLAFATKLINGSFKLSRCVHMNEAGNEKNKEEIETILLMLGYEL